MDKKKRQPEENRREERDPVEILGEAMNGPVTEETDGRLRASLAEFREELERHPYVKRIERARERGTRFRRRPSLLRRVALSGVAAVLILIVVLLLPFGNGTPTWAEVVQRFETVISFKMTIYEKDGLLEDALQYEYWRGRGGKSRLRYGSQVIFGDRGKVTKSFDVRKRMEVPEDDMVATIIRKLGGEDRFSLEILFGLFSQGSVEMKETTATVNANSTISHDLVVFDVTERGMPFWYRVWALKESRLPVRILAVNPRSNWIADLLFTYGKDQPGEFFDPEEFARKLADPSVVTEDLVFGDQHDPLGKPITRRQLRETQEKLEPKEVRDEIGTPVVEEAGVDEDGAVWVKVKTGARYDPNRRPIELEWNIGDPMGREYQRVYGSTRYRGTEEEVWSLVFAPEGYPFDMQRPESVVLIMESLEYTREGPKRTPLERLSLENLERGVRVPWIEDKSDLLLSHARWLKERGRYDESTKILGLIPGEPEESEAALQREQIRLSILVKQGANWEEAVTLGAKLEPLLEQQYASFDRRFRLRGTNVYSFEDYIRALLRTGRFEEAATVVQRILAIPVPEVPEDLGLSERLQRETRKRMQHYDVEEIPSFAYQISGGLTLEEMNALFGTDVLEDERFSKMAGTFIQRNRQNKSSEERAEHERETMKYFETHPWPEEAVLVPAKSTKPGMNYRFGPVAGKPGYRCECIIGKPFETLGDYFRTGRSYGAGRVRMPEDIQKIELEHCLVFRMNLPERLRDEAVLDFFGLEAVESTEPRTVWVATYDGRQLKPYTEVKAPFPYDREREKKTGTARDPAGAQARYTLSWLFDGLMRDRDPSLSAEGILIVDETGISSNLSGTGEAKAVYISSDMPYWTGEGGPEMAKEWFEKEFGITFPEEVRPETVYVVRRKNPSGGE